MRKRSKATDMHQTFVRRVQRDIFKLQASEDCEGDSKVLTYAKRLLAWLQRQATRTATKKGGLGRR